MQTFSLFKRYELPSTQSELKFILDEWKCKFEDEID